MNNFIPYGRQEITEDDITSVIKTLKSEYLTQGPKVEEFEEKIREKTNSKFAVCVNSATSALHLSCIALGLGVMIMYGSPITFVASANCAKYCGCLIDFVDINPNDGLMDMDKLEQKLKKLKK